MAKGIFNLKLNPLKKLRQDYKDSIKREASLYIKTRYEEITAPFETDFEFEVVENELDGELQFHVKPVEKMIDRPNNNGEVNSLVLFNALDQGSSGTAKVFLPKDFKNESSPNSVSTSHKTYDRTKIFVDSSKKGQDMDGRNWSILVAEEFENRRLKKIRNLTNFLVDSAIGHQRNG